MRRIKRTTIPANPGSAGWYVRERNDADVLCERIGPDVVEMVNGHPRGMVILRHFLVGLLEAVQLFPVAGRGVECPAYVTDAVLDWWNANVPPHPSEGVDP